MTKEELLAKIRELRETRLPSKRQLARKAKTEKLRKEKDVSYDTEVN